MKWHDFPIDLADVGDVRLDGFGERQFGRELTGRASVDS
jgi:hypothetical protein